MKIYYLCPDERKPCGGVKVEYMHVDILNRNGFDAYVVHNEAGFKCNWFENKTKITYLSDINPSGDDYVVIPEIYGLEIANIFPDIKKIIFNQGVYNTFYLYSLNPDDLFTPYRSKDVIATMVVSEDSQNYLKFAFPGIKIIRSYNSIDSSVFSYSANKKKQICFMPRRNLIDAKQVINILKFRNIIRDFNVVEIENKSEKEVSEILKDSLIFLSLGYHEGWPLPPAEAMSCGCVVVGYSGRGGGEYFKKDFSFPIETGDIVGFAKKVEELINLYTKNPKTVIEMGKKASDFIKSNYSREIEERNLINLWNKILFKKKVENSLKEPYGKTAKKIKTGWQDFKVSILDRLLSRMPIKLRYGFILNALRLLGDTGSLNSGHFELEDMEYLIKWIENDAIMKKILPDIYRTMRQENKSDEKLSYYYKFNEIISEMADIKNIKNSRQLIDFLNDFKTKKHLLEMELSYAEFDEDISDIQEKLQKLYEVSLKGKGV